jgi:hypothetical protein
VSAAAGVAVLSGPYMEHVIIALVLVALMVGLIGVVIVRVIGRIRKWMHAAEQHRARRARTVTVHAGRVRLPRVGVAAAVLVLAAGCARTRPAFAPLPACAPAPASTAGWEAKTEHLFTFQLPPGLRHGTIRGIDSTPGTHTGRGLRIVYEQGPYAGPSPGWSEDQRNGSECTTTIGGVQAHVASWNTPREGYALHAAWRRIAPAGPFGDTNLAISIQMRSSDPQSQAVAHAIIHSVRFPPPSQPVP